MIRIVDPRSLAPFVPQAAGSPAAGPCVRLREIEKGAGRHGDGRRGRGRGQRAARLKGWQGLTVGLMVLGYAGFYLCRSNLSATMPLIIDDLAQGGTDPAPAKWRLGRWVVSLGTIAYALGKFAAGRLTDLLGGRRNYLIGMAGAVVCTAGLCAGRLAAGLHAGLVRQPADPVAGLAGDDQDHVAMVLVFVVWHGDGDHQPELPLRRRGGPGLHRLLDRHLGPGLAGASSWSRPGCWRSLWVVNAVLLRESPGELGLPEPATNPENLFGKLGEDPHPESAGPLWSTLARSPAFWIVCLLSLGLTLLRETFNNWTPTYLVQGVGLDKGDAAGMSAAVPVLRRGLGDPGRLPRRPAGPPRPGGDHPGGDRALRAGAGPARLGELPGPAAGGAGPGRRWWPSC